VERCVGQQREDPVKERNNVNAWWIPEGRGLVAAGGQQRLWLGWSERVCREFITSMGGMRIE
jgi:hypothetical protein